MYMRKELCRESGYAAYGDVLGAVRAENPFWQIMESDKFWYMLILFDGGFKVVAGGEIAFGVLYGIVYFPVYK